MHAKHPQLLQHCEQEERVAAQRVTLQCLHLLRRQCLAVASEVFADEAFLLNLGEGLDLQLLPGQATLGGFLDLAMQAGGHQVHLGW